MFGMGGTEIIVILIVALLFLGPDKLPEAAKQISKGIRDIKKQSRVLQRTIEDDEHIGGAIRDLKSALRGDEEPIRPRPIKSKQIEAAVAAATAAALPDPDVHAHDDHHEGHDAAHDAASAMSVAEHGAVTVADGEHGPAPASVVKAEPVEGAPAPKISLPPTAGQHDDGARPSDDDATELAALIKPAPNTIARSTAVPAAFSPAASAAVVPAVVSASPVLSSSPVIPTAVIQAAVIPAPVAPAATGTDSATPAATSDTSEPKHG